VAKRGFRFDAWDVFIADELAAVAASEAIVHRELPEGLADLRSPTEPDGQYTAQIQASMAAAGVVAVERAAWSG